MAQRILLIALLMYMFCVRSYLIPDCQPAAEEGKPYTIHSDTCVANGSDRVRWFGGGLDIFDGTTNLYQNHFGINPADPSNITIRNVTRTGRSPIAYHCTVGTHAVYSCYLSSIYKNPEVPTCSEVTLGSDNNITITCTTSKVFPAATCQFSVRSTTLTSDVYISTTDVRLPGDLEYYTSTCVLKYPVTGMPAGNLTVQVLMYPSDMDLSANDGVSSEDTYLELSIPTVSIVNGRCLEESTDVKYGYIRPGTTVSCRCTLFHTGVPTGSLRWTKPNGTRHVGDTVLIQEEGNYICEGVSVLSGPFNTETVTASYAGGPSSVEIHLSNQTTTSIDVCSSTGVTVTVYCDVAKDDVTPAVTRADFDIPAQNGLTVTRQGDTDSTGDKYRQRFRVHVTSAGTHSLTCVVENSLFRDTSTQHTMSIESRIPPSNKPVIVVVGETKGEAMGDARVTCTVTGGTPPVDTVTLQCGEDYHVVSKGTSVTVYLESIKPMYNGTQYTCTATHITGCYNLETIANLETLPSTTRKAVGDSSISTSTIALAVTTTLLFLVIIVIIVIIATRRRREALRVSKLQNLNLEEIQPEPPRRPPEGQRVQPQESHPVYGILDLLDNRDSNIYNVADSPYEMSVGPVPDTQEHQIYVDFIGSEDIVSQGYVNEIQPEPPRRPPEGKRVQPQQSHPVYGISDLLDNRDSYLYNVTDSPYEMSVGLVPDTQEHQIYVDFKGSEDIVSQGYVNAISIL